MKIQIEEANLRTVLEALEKTTGAFLDTEGSHGQTETDALDSAHKAISICKQALEQLAQQ